MVNHWTGAVRIVAGLDHPEAGAVRAKLAALGPRPGLALVRGAGPGGAPADRADWAQAFAQ